MFAVRSLTALALLGLSVSASAAKIDPELLRALRQNNARGPMQVVINLPGKFDVRRLNNLRATTQLERGRAIKKSMEAYTLQQSERLRAFLAGPGGAGVERVDIIWVANSIRLRAKKETIHKLLQLNSAFEGMHLDKPKEVSELADTGEGTLFTPVNSRPKLAWGVEKLGAPKVWETGALGEGAIVAVIDSGVNVKHPDLAPNIWKNPGETGTDANGKDKASNGVDDDENGFIDDIVGWNFEDRNNDPMDDNGHGTQAAGIVGGMGANGTQTGVAPKATIMALKSCCSAGGQIFESNTWEAIQYAIANGAKVISMSLSAKPPSNPTYAKWRQVGEAELAAQLIHVNSAGNLGTGREPFNMGAPPTNPPAWHFPDQTKGGTSSMITIGATDKEDKVRYYSSGGPVTWEHVDEYKDYTYSKGEKPGLIKPEVCGPSEVPSTSKDGVSYTSSFGGTSSATPHIAGVVALLVSAKPDLTPEQATEALMNTALHVRAESSDEDFPPFNNRCGAGRVDIPAALEYVKTKF